MIHGLYVHIPFCAKRCHYCDFNTYEGLENLAEPYTQALLEDLRRCAEQGPAAAPGGLRSVYFGGGTPSLLEPELLLAVLEEARRRFGLAEGAEVTLEANPGTVDEARLGRLRRGGFNRLSFGFQAAQDRHLAALGRNHGAEQSAQAWAAARAAGFGNLSLDLMLGLSGQSQSEWQESLAWALAFRPEHLSFYGLTVEAGTPYHRWAAEGRLPLPGEDEQAAMVEAGVAALEGAGLRQYEISNFARPGFEAVHNRLYWLNLETLGLGAGAWSWVGGRRSARLRLPRAYMAALAEGREPLAESERLEGRAARGEAALLRLRLSEGLDLQAWREEQGRGFLEEFGAELKPAFAAACLEREGERLRLTPKGRLLANEVFARLI